MLRESSIRVNASTTSIESEDDCLDVDDDLCRRRGQGRPTPVTAPRTSDNAGNAGEIIYALQCKRHLALEINISAAGTDARCHEVGPR